jgi:lipooligosaccharide transport system ATP-binding protein
LMIARALLHEPRLLALDEPTTGLDPQVRQEIWQRLEELRRRSRITILLSTHYMEEAEKLCDRLLIINRGRILATGAPRQLISESVAHYTLEVRDTLDLQLVHQSLNGVRAVARTGAHFYFADTPEQLTPLLRFYEGRRVLLRPSNLEDAFLDLIGEDPSWEGGTDGVDG